MTPANSRLISCATALLTAMLALPATASDNTYYQWRDERGTAHHSDKPPPEGVDYEVVSPDSGFKRVVSAEEGIVPLETEPTVGNDFERISKKPEEIEKNPILCERATKNLETLNGTAKVSVRNDQGEARFLSDEEIELQKDLAEKNISRHCD